jgi:hypothetical protein
MFDILSALAALPQIPNPGPEWHLAAITALLPFIHYKERPGTDDEFYNAILA